MEGVGGHWIPGQVMEAAGKRFPQPMVNPTAPETQSSASKDRRES